MSQHHLLLGSVLRSHQDRRELSAIMSHDFPTSPYQGANETWRLPNAMSIFRGDSRGARSAPSRTAGIDYAYGCDNRLHPLAGQAVASRNRRIVFAGQSAAGNVRVAGRPANRRRRRRVLYPLIEIRLDLRAAIFGKVNSPVSKLGKSAAAYADGFGDVHRSYA